MSRRIISLVPSATEMLYYMGLETRIVGVTEHCNFPEEAKSKYKIGTFAQPQLTRILYLEPDLVLADEAIHRKTIRELEKSNIPVLSATPITVEDIFTLMNKLGILTQTQNKAVPLVTSLRDRAETLSQNPIARRPRVFRLMSTGTYITPGPKAFQYDALQLAGAQMMNLDGSKPYVQVSWRQIEEFDPEIILFCGVNKGQPLPEKCKGCPAKLPICHRTAEDIFGEEWQRISAVRENRVYPISCHTICRPGPRLIDGIEKLRQLFE
nr:helical backbone metal receptor [Desulfosporosinus orientis]